MISALGQEEVRRIVGTLEVPYWGWVEQRHAVAKILAEADSNEVDGVHCETARRKLRDVPTINWSKC